MITIPGDNYLATGIKKTGLRLLQLPDKSHLKMIFSENGSNLEQLRNVLSFSVTSFALSYLGICIQIRLYPLLYN